MTEKEVIKMSEMMEKIYKVLTNKQYVRYKPGEYFIGAVLKKIETAIDSQKPITLVIGFGYHKNPNACENLLPDIAEETALQRLANYAKTIEEIYPLGMKVKIVTSGRRSEIVNGMNPEHIQSYHFALQKMAEQNGWQIIKVISLGSLYNEFCEDFQSALEVAKKKVIPDWNDSFWIQQAEHAKRNIYQKGLNEDQIIQKTCQSACDYVVYHRAEVEANLLEKKFPGAIRASYNRHEESLVLWTTAKGAVTQPWQGKGEKDDSGRITIITQKRKRGG